MSEKQPETEGEPKPETGEGEEGPDQPDDASPEEEKPTEPVGA